MWLTWLIMKWVAISIILPIKKSDWSLKKTTHFECDCDWEWKIMIDFPSLPNTKKWVHLLKLKLVVWLEIWPILFFWKLYKAMSNSTPFLSFLCSIKPNKYAYTAINSIQNDNMWIRMFLGRNWFLNGMQNQYCNTLFLFFFFIDNKWSLNSFLISGSGHTGL